MTKKREEAEKSEVQCSASLCASSALLSPPISSPVSCISLLSAKPQTKKLSSSIVRAATHWKLLAHMSELDDGAAGQQ